MPRIRFTETYLSSSIIIMPTSNFEKLKEKLATYNNTPDLIDVSETVNVDPLGIRIHPDLSFFQIEDVHDGSLYLKDDSGDSVDLVDEIYKHIQQGSEFKIQLVQLEGNGMQFSSYLYGSTGLISHVSDNPLCISAKYLSRAD